MLVHMGIRSSWHGKPMTFKAQNKSWAAKSCWINISCEEYLGNYKTDFFLFIVFWLFFMFLNSQILKIELFNAREEALIPVLCSFSMCVESIRCDLGIPKLAWWMHITYQSRHLWPLCCWCASRCGPKRMWFFYPHLLITFQTFIQTANKQN